MAKGNRAGLVTLAILAGFAICASGCSSSGTKKATTTTASPSTGAKAGGLSITITSFGPLGTNVEVDFAADNTGTSEERFEWAEYVLTAPDGTHHTASRDPGSAPYRIVDAGGSFDDGGIFQFPRFMAGHYSISYAGHVLQEKLL
jgi:hypothetical protein